MKKIFFLSIILLTASLLYAQSNAALDLIINNFSARTFADGAITRQELDQIILAGIRTPSAMNQQPWHFTVVENSVLVRQILPQITTGNILILVSAAGDGLTNGPAILDCALAAHSIYLAAQALGLGSRIYTNPVAGINSRFKAQLALPADHNVIALVRIGRLPPGADTVSSPSPRHNTDRVVTYR